MTILEAKRISKSFPGVQALDNVSFSVEEGEILGLVGENGAGKSTLMKILSGYYPHSSYQGELLVRGDTAKFSQPLDAEQMGVEMIYQEINMHLDLTVAENIHLGRWPKGRFGLVDGRKMSKESTCFLQMIGAEFRPTEMVRSLSASRQQQVAIARALFRDPAVLILDEPTSVLTNKEADALFATLDYLNREHNLTVILISHKLEEVLENTHRIVTLRDGKTVGEHRTDEVDKDTIVHEMVGRRITSFYHKETVEKGAVAFEVRNLSVPHPDIKDRLLVDSVGFSVREGEILGVAGLVGAGRSEMVNAVFGTIRRISGDVAVGGLPVQRSAPRSSIQKGIGLITEDRKRDGLVLLLSVKENTTLASLGSVQSAGFLQRQVESIRTQELVDVLRIKAPSTDTVVGTLSGGNQQKVVIAKWLMAGSRVLLLDEPTRGVDIGAKEEIYRLIGDFVRRGMAVVLISSELPELTALSDRIIVLRSGRVSAEIERPDFDGAHIMSFAV
jgi:ABC-type sugar transport system ATPase subunit